MSRRLGLRGILVARHLLALGSFVALVVAVPRTASAQWNTVLTVTGWPLTVTSTTGNDFEAGFVSLGTTSFNVDATSNLFNWFNTRVTSVEVQCVAACPRTGTLSATGIQWRRDDQATWTNLTTAYVEVEERTVQYNGTNDPWSRTMQWRYLLSWTAHPPTAASQFRVRFRLVVSAP